MVRNGGLNRMHSIKKRKVLSLRAQLMLRFVVIMLISIIIVSGFSMICISYFGLQEKRSTETADLNLLTNVINAELMYAREAGISVAFNSFVQDCLKRSGIREEYKENDDIIYKMRAELISLFNPSKIHSVYVYGINDDCYTSQPTVLLDKGVIDSYEWFQDGVSSGENSFWGGPIFINNTWLVAYVRKIIDSDNRIVLGYAIVNFYESVLNRNFLTHGNIYLILENGTIISCDERGKINTNYYDMIGMTLSNERISKKKYDFFSSHGGKHYLIYHNTYNYPSLAKVFTYNPSELIIRMLIFTTIVAAFCMVVCTLLSADQARRFIRPLRKMRERMDAMQPGVPSEQMHPRTNDEIGMLMDSFNNLSSRLTSSLEEIQRINEMRRKAEYRAIELQINPHFLYNTLSLIIYLADAQEIEKVKGVAAALSKLFRISVNHGKELVRILDEVNHLRCYMDILSIRHQGEFNYLIDVDPDIMEYYTIKIILQPLVENAIQHGIRDNLIKNGLIRVSIFKHNDRIIFEVEDNGSTPQETIDKMNEAIMTGDNKNSFGIGMRNVHNRVHMFFHDDYGLKYYKQGEHTIAHIEIPILKEDKE